MKFVIVGSGPAGIFATEAIRRRDKESPITMVTADPQVAHSPVMLSYWMAGNRPREILFFRDPSWLEKMRIEVRLGSRATSLHTATRRIVLADRQEIDYESLLIATGATPLSLPIPGIKSKGVTSLRTPYDVEMILGDRPGVREIIIIGGGFIGLKLACHLKERGLEITVLEKEPKLAVRMFDLQTSRIVKETLQEKGISVETDVEVREVVRDKGWVAGVATREGRLLPCQRIIEAVGVRPNIHWLTDSGIEIKEGILVNNRLETNIPGVHAAGDVAMTLDSVTSERVNNATWPSATRQGTVAGTNMAGGSLTYLHNFTMNALNLFGLRVMAAGHSYYDEGSGVDLLSEERGKSYRKIVIKDGRLIGFILIGDISGAGHLLRWMKRGDEIPHGLRNLLLSSGSLGRVLPPNLGFRHGLIFT